MTNESKPHIRPDQEIAAYLNQDFDQDLRIWARKVLADVPSGTPDSELTEEQRRAWEILDAD